jgi:hypothetical protein
MGRIKPKTMAELMDVQTDLQMERMHAKTRELNHLKMTDQTGTSTRGDDPATTTTTALIAK